MDIQKRIIQLTSELNQHNYNYYNLDNPTISDYEFDTLLKELESLEAKYPEFKQADSPTMRVGGQITKIFPVFTHLRQMLSLGNSYSREDLTNFDEQVVKLAGGNPFTYFLEHKFDGVSMSLHYEKGVLVRAVTRGDGMQGDEVTANVKTIRTIPLKLNGTDIPDFIEIRGEVMMLRKAFEDWNNERELNGEDRLMNPRNATSGALKQQDSAEVARRPLTFFAYQIANEEQSAPTDFENVARFQQWGFKVSGHHAQCANMEAVLTYINEWESKRFDLDYDIDGIVIKVNEVGMRGEIGYTSKTPRWAIAFKYPAASITTKLLSVDFQVGRTGKITPVANLEPVLLAGTIVKRASIHNADEILRLDLHNDDVVNIEKGGEIIPKITSVAKRTEGAKPIEFITHCPDCGTLLVRPEKEVNYFCFNENGCPTQLKGKIEHFAHRKAMNIDGLGTEIVSKLVDAGFVKNYADLYDLKYEDLLKLDKFGDQSAKNLLAALENSKKISFEKVLFALGIRHVGSSGAKKLAKHFGSLAAMQAASVEELTNVTDVGETTAKTVKAFLDEPANQTILQRLENAGLQMVGEAPKTPMGNLLAGKSFVISGTFVHYTRDGLKEYIESQGGEVKGGVTKKVTYLIAGAEAGPSKIEKAEKEKVTILSEDDFRALIGGV